MTNDAGLIEELRNVSDDFPALDVCERAASRLSAQAVEIERLRGALEPFAKFRLEGFEGEVLEVVPSSPDNPARRIEPIWTTDFRRARQTLAEIP